MRKRIFGIVELADERDRLSHAYDIIMMAVIILSLVPLAIKQQHAFISLIDKVTTGIFILDYIMRLLTADMKLKRGWLSFLLYPFTFMAIVDLLSILPSLILMSNAFKVLKMARFLRALRVFKAFKSFRYSKNIALIAKVFSKQKKSLLTVCVLAVGYILISALVVFNVEPDTFPTYFDAVYWATVSLTTVGYGDIFATSTVGKLITMISALLGVAIVALPAGIITAGYMNEISKDKESISDSKDAAEDLTRKE